MAFPEAQASDMTVVSGKPQKRGTHTSLRPISNGLDFQVKDVSYHPVSTFCRSRPTEANKDSWGQVFLFRKDHQEKTVKI